MTSRKTKTPKRPKTEPTAPPARKRDQATESRIVVRDRRARYQFSVHNTVIDQWLPILGPIGFTLYSLYCRMANHADERCFPGYTLIRSHLGLGWSTISDYNKLLEWCELIHIEPGDRKRSNDYYLLDIPEVTPDKLEEITNRIKSRLSPTSTFRKAVLQRIEAWQPLQANFADRSSRPAVISAAQLKLPEGTPVGEEGTLVSEEGTPVGEEGTPVSEDPAPLDEEGTPPGREEQSESNNPKLTIRNQQSEGNNPKSTSSRTGRRNGGTADDADLPLSSLNDLMKSINIRDLKAQRKMVRLVEEHGYTLSELSVMYEIAREKADKNPTGYWMRWVESGQHMAGSSEGVDAMWEYYKSTADLPY